MMNSSGVVCIDADTLCMLVESSLCFHAVNVTMIAMCSCFSNLFHFSD